MILRQTTSLGVRVSQIERVAISRRFITVLYPGGYSVKVKVGFMEGKPIKLKPEFDQCKEIAIATGESIQSVTDTLVRLGQAHLDREESIRSEADEDVSV